MVPSKSRLSLRMNGRSPLFKLKRRLCANLCKVIVAVTSTTVTVRCTRGTPTSVTIASSRPSGSIVKS